LFAAATVAMYTQVWRSTQARKV